MELERLTWRVGLRTPRCPRETIQNALEIAGRRTGRLNTAKQVLRSIMPDDETIACATTKRVAEHHAGGMHADAIREGEAYLLGTILRPERGRFGVVLIDYDKLVEVPDRGILITSAAIMAVVKATYRITGANIAASHTGTCLTDVFAAIDVFDVIRTGTS